MTTYLNHYWFASLLGIVLLVVPSGARWSLDARRTGPRPVPLGALWLVRAQIGVVYGFAGLAKLSTDWLLHGQPLRVWLPARSDLAIIGPWLDEAWVAHGSSWAGAAFDLWIETGQDLYTPNQWRAMTTEPELIRQAAHAVAERQAARGHEVEVRVDAFVALNGWPAQRLVDPRVDLAREPWRIHQPWILPAPTSSPS